VVGVGGFRPAPSEGADVLAAVPASGERRLTLSGGEQPLRVALHARTSGSARLEREERYEGADRSGFEVSGCDIHAPDGGGDPRRMTAPVGSSASAGVCSDMAVRSAVSAPTAEQAANLAAWRALALERMPYLATTLFALRFVDAPGLKTFAVDANLRCYIDFDAVGPRGSTWCAESLLHECMHVLGQHASRADADCGQTRRVRKLWGYAADMEINDDLVDAGCGTLAADGILPSTFGFENYQTAETYLAEMLRMGAEPAEGAEAYGCGSGAGSVPVPFELEPGSDCDGAAPAASDVEVQMVRVATAAAIMDAASKSAGRVPAGLVRTASGLLEPPKVDWRRTLAAFIRRGVAARSGAFDSTYARRNRRRPTTPLGEGRVVNPGTYAPAPTIAVVRDTSGSMTSAELAEVGSEIEGIARAAGVSGDALRVFDVDSEVGAVRNYRGPGSVAEAVGGGGTDMGVGIAAACESRPLPTVIVVATDGFTPWPTVRPPAPVVVVIVGDGGGVEQNVPDWAAGVVTTGSRPVG